LPSPRAEELNELHLCPAGLLDYLPLGVILTDENCRVLMLNRTARDVLIEDDGLTLRGDFLVASSSQQNIALRRLVRDVLRGGDADGPLGRRGVITLPRPSCGRSHEIVVISLRQTVGALTPTVAAAFIGTEMIDSEAAVEIVAPLYGLTAAEARVAVVLMQGRSLTEVAIELRVSKETARKHLRALFRKTLTNRQSELVRLLVGGPVNLRLMGARSLRRTGT
jgi:DNA-binding CsgD family transcriptional regulator